MGDRFGEEAWDRVLSYGPYSRQDFMCNCNDATFTEEAHMFHATQVQVDANFQTHTYTIASDATDEEVCEVLFDVLENLDSATSDYECPEGSGHLIHDGNWRVVFAC